MCHVPASVMRIPWHSHGTYLASISFSFLRGSLNSKNTELLLAPCCVRLCLRVSACVFLCLSWSIPACPRVLTQLLILHLLEMLSESSLFCQARNVRCSFSSQDPVDTSITETLTMCCYLSVFPSSRFLAS